MEPESGSKMALGGEGVSVLGVTPHQDMCAGKGKVRVRGVGGLRGVPKLLVRKSGLKLVHNWSETGLLFWYATAFRWDLHVDQKCGIV